MFRSIRPSVVSVFVIGALIALGAFFFLPNTSSNTTSTSGTTTQLTTEEKTYKTVTSTMIAVSADEFTAAASKEKAFVYIGRVTCPSCVTFINTIASLDVSSVYYINTDETSDALSLFAETNGITSVPQLLLFENGTISHTFEITDETTPADVEQFLAI